MFKRIFTILSIFITFFSYQKRRPELYVPKGFEVTIVIDSIPGGARQIAVNDNGDIYVKLKSPGYGANIALRDTNYDGRADIIKPFGNYPEVGYYGTAMRIHNGYLYFSTELVVYRAKLVAGQLLPEEKLEKILVDDHPHGNHEHNGKPIAFDDAGHMYVPFGAPSNACQEDNRVPFSPGIDPCPLLTYHAGVWRFDANKNNQTQKDGQKYASGLRSLVAFEWNHFDNNLYTVMHGIDDLHRNWPNKFSVFQNTILPSEEFLKLEEGSNSGWPYCYYDHIQGKKLLTPEYGGDGKIVGRCENFNKPIIGFPGHWAPNDLLFYGGDQFPEHYKNGAFISFHGSTIRSPYPQAGYFIGFVPYVNGKFQKSVEVFADGFANKDPIINVSDAVYRPMGIAMGPDGSMYFADTEKGRIWRVKYKGEKSIFGADDLANMVKRKMTASNIRAPHFVNDNLEKNNKNKKEIGEKLYTTYCSTCHQNNGLGASGRFPSLVSDWVKGDKTRLINVLLKGLEGDIMINNEKFNGVMPKHNFLKNEDIASILTFVRSNFGNHADAITTKEVQFERQKKIN